MLYDDLYGTCGGADGTHLIFSGEIAGGHRIYAGDEFEQGTSFSHLDGNCVAGTSEFVDFVMHRNFPLNTARRILLDAELDILRTIGYNIDCEAAEYTDFDCEATDCALGSVHNGINIATCGPN